MHWGWRSSFHGLPPGVRTYVQGDLEIKYAGNRANHNCERRVPIDQLLGRQRWWIAFAG